MSVVDRVWIVQEDGERFTVSVNHHTARVRLRGFMIALELARRLSAEHQADIWIQDGHSTRLFEGLQNGPDTGNPAAGGDSGRSGDADVEDETADKDEKGD